MNERAGQPGGNAFSNAFRYCNVSCLKYDKIIVNLLFKEFHISVVYI